VTGPTSWIEFTAAGGQTPMTAEFLAVESDGAARYLTGNPWPDQPPFDEIGAYAGPLADATVNLLRGQAAEIGAARAQLADAPRELDSGAMQLTVRDAAEAWTLAWGPYDAPAPLMALERMLRQAIRGLRADHREATLAAMLDERDGKLMLRLRNRGSEAFAGRVDAVWLSQEHDDATAREAAGDPVELHHAEPVAIAATVRLSGGAETSLSLDAPAPVPGRLLRALIGAHWMASWPERSPAKAEGWLLPEPFSGR
jgi:hypothetical protein